MDIFAAENRLNQEFFANWWRRRLRQRIETDFVRFLVVGGNDLYWILVSELLKIFCILSYNMVQINNLAIGWLICYILVHCQGNLTDSYYDKKNFFDTIFKRVF